MFRLRNHPAFAFKGGCATSSCAQAPLLTGGCCKTVENKAQRFPMTGDGITDAHFCDETYRKGRIG
jgi:hypothetical protein